MGLTNNFFGAVSPHPFSSLIPGQHLAGGIEHKDRVVLNIFDRRTKTLFGLVLAILRRFAFADIDDAREHVRSVGCLDWVQADFDGELAAVLACGEEFPPGTHRPALRSGGEGLFPTKRMRAAEAARQQYFDRLT